MQTTPQADFHAAHVRRYYAARLHAPSVAFRAALAETLTDWRLGRANQRASFHGAAEIVAAGIGEIAALRFQLLYLPVLESLARIEARVGILADLKPEPYAPLRRRS